jgi:hypothetical protein
VPSLLTKRRLGLPAHPHLPAHVRAGYRGFETPGGDAVPTEEFLSAPLVGEAVV